MYLQANPDKARSEGDKEEMKGRYTPGENVLPKVNIREEREDEAEDRRMMEEVREMSLRELDTQGSGSYERGIRHRARDRARDAREEERRRQPDGEMARPSTATDAASRSRQIEHQSSLRSLLSSSDVESSDMEEEILRQIMDEGILDGIDLNNIDVSTEDELSERIADAYRRRHGQRTRARQTRAEELAPIITHEQRRSRERQHRRPSRSPNALEQTHNTSHPPVSRPHLLEAYPTGHGHRRRTSSESRRQTSPVPPSSSRRSSIEIQRPAARSATDIASGTQTSSNRGTRPANLASGGRRTTDPDSHRARGSSRDRIAQAQRSPDSRSRDISSIVPHRPNLDVISSPRDTGSDGKAPSPSSSESSRPTQQESNPSLVSQDQLPMPVNASSPPQIFPEPSIACDRCGKENVQYNLHWNCSQCREGRYNLCQRCYLSGRGCLYWYGFGYAAMQRFTNQRPAPGSIPTHSLPHRLKGRRYLRPLPQSVQPATSDLRLRSTSDPDNRVQSGPFCSNCSKYTPECYWTCSVCNEGEWGFCNSCVNQGKCCTHALLPMTHNSAKRAFTNSSQASSENHVAIPDQISPISSGRSSTDPIYGEEYRPLTFSTKCDICTYPVPPSITRFHCLQCNAGDYDIDAACYYRLVHTGKISTTNGPKGWRRCPNGHRMIIVGFEDSNIGQRRIVVADLVGGHALKDDVNADGSPEWTWREGQQRQTKTVSKASTSMITTASETPANDGTPPLLKKYPPNGGVGMHIEARWSWWPQEGANDELAFPKGAEIRESEDINGDWFWGIYCARKGVFPSNYGRVLETVGIS